MLTREIEDNLEITSFLQKYYSDTPFLYIHSPLIKYTSFKIENHFLQSYSNIIITSKIGARILAELPDSILYNKNIWVVGEKSNEILIRKNLRIQYVARNISDLISVMPHDIYKQTIYLSSNEITRHLSDEIKREIIYKVDYSTELEDIGKIKEGVDYSLLYSVNSAKTLIKLLAKNNILDLLKKMTVIVISKKVGDIFSDFTDNIYYSKEESSREILEIMVRDAKAKILHL